MAFQKVAMTEGGGKIPKKYIAMSAGRDPFRHGTLKHRRTTLERAEKFISNVYFTDVNLFGRLYRQRAPITCIRHFGPTEKTYEEIKSDRNLFKAFSIGKSFGPTFTRHWFELDIAIPESWVDHKVQLIWSTDCEGMVWRDDEPVFALTAMEDRGVLKAYTIYEKLERKHDKSVTLIISASCNRLLGEGKDGMINAPDMEKMFCLKQAEIVQVDEDACNAFFDLQVLYDLAKALPEDSQRSADALQAGNDVINCLVRGDFSTQAYNDARTISQKFFRTTNADGQHLVHAMGHCHIDSAWLWPYSETIHKCARSWISTISLMDKFPDFTFVCSQAQQFSWVKDNYPKVYEKLKHYVKLGRFIPVGGTWVEMDGNLPSGETMIRQFVYGQRYFREEFGITCREFWLPDTFGYSANLPQIMNQAGIRNFLTQKLSWSLFNTFPHNTFFWEGIDGSRVLSHFPPGNSYGMHATAEELINTMKNHKDKARSDDSVFLFGYGDGGGGPTEEMLHRLSRMSDCSGLPKVQMSNPDNFFDAAWRREDKLCTWVGELFLELHNGTYTTQAKIKKYNRKCEVLLHNAELASTLAWLAGFSNGFKGTSSFDYPSSELDRIWKLLLLNQFHDVLPGSSIEMVNSDACKYYEDITNSAESLIDTAAQSRGEFQKTSVANFLAWDRTEVIEMDEGELAFVCTPSMGIGPANLREALPVRITEECGTTISMENEHLKCTFDNGGRLTSLVLKKCEDPRELVQDGCFANQMVLFDDVPLFWDAWDTMDYHLETRQPVLDVADPLHISEKSRPLRGALEFSLRVGKNSTVTQTIELDAGCPYIRFTTRVDWHENHKFLKVEFPWNVRSPKATYEIQFGHLERPTHQNTSWDSARFEVWAHKWADLSQFDQGVAILNDCKYGYSTFGNVMRLSLLRSPKAPDANADMGQHEFTYAVMPHAGSFQEAGVIKQAYQLNNPLRLVKGFDADASSLVAVDGEAVILDTCKKSDLHENALLLRLYESFGGSSLVKVSFPSFKIEKVARCNALEDVDDSDIVTYDDKSISLTFTPFQIQSILVWPV